MTKSKLENIWLVASLLAIIVLVGCSTLDRAYHQQTTVTPGLVVTNVFSITNTVVIEQSTNPATGQVIPPSVNYTITTTTNYVISPSTTNTVLVPREDVSIGIEATKNVPVPWAGVVGVALGWLYTGYAAIRNRKTSVALIQGIEAGRRFLQETPEGQRFDVRMKDALIQTQKMAGTRDQTSQLVNRYTQDTIAPGA